MDSKVLSMHSKPYQNGHNARTNGVERVMNPYNRGSKDQKMWFMGWEERDKEMSQ